MYRNFKLMGSGKARLATTLLKAAEGLIQEWIFGKSNKMY